ncbi:MAG: hypothetical protein ACXAC7_08000 [Candidatus Hodarchaeales archaeon]|jgi:hypothetical protein
MNLRISKSRKHYRPILVSIWGNYPDPYVEARDRMYERMIKTPTHFAMLAGENLYNAYNESLQFCLDNKFRYFILAYQDIQPHGDWSEVFRTDEYSKPAFIYNENYHFVLVNVRKVKIYGFFKNKTNNIKALLFWMLQKSISEGHNTRVLTENELNLIGDVGDEPRPKERRKEYNYEQGWKTKNKSSRKKQKKREY